MSILNCLPCKSERIFPSGYIYKNGIAVESKGGLWIQNKLNIPSNIIPLVLYQGGGTGEARSSFIKLVDSKGKVLSQVRKTSGDGLYLDGSYISLENYYSNIEELNLISSFQLQCDSTYSTGDIRVVTWLEKSGGGGRLNAFLSRLKGWCLKMPIFNNLPTKKGSANVEEITAVKLCFPFTTDLRDNSIYDVPITNSGVTLGSDGAVVNSSNTISIGGTPYNYTGEFTFEAIINAKLISEYNYFFTNSVTKSFGVTFIRSTKTIRVISYATEDFQFDYTPYFEKETSIAVVCSSQFIRLYINGELKKEYPRFSGMFLRMNGATIGNNINDQQLSAIIGGIKITYRALEPSQFSLTRPFEPVLPDFKVGTRTYIYDNGLWNPSFQKQVSAGVIFEQDRIKIPQGNNLDISTGDFSGKTIVMEFFATLIAGGISNGSLCYISLIDSSSVVRKVVYNLTSNNESVNVVRTMGIKYSDGLPKTRIKSENNQLIYISRIWIED